MEESAFAGQPPLDYFAHLREPDPDNPSWGIPSGIGAWVISIVSQIVAFMIVAIPWVIAMQNATGQQPTEEGMKDWISTPSGAIVVLVSTILGQIITFIACWMIVTRNGEKPFFKSLGWHWGDLNLRMRTFFVAGVVSAMYGLNFIFSRFLPNAENTDFEKLINSSQAARILVAAMAVLAAPIVEEVVYRGVLYSGLRRKLGVAASVLIVTVLFAGVHVPQYWGAWAGVAGLTFLSLVLTMIRARTKTILPCVAVHLVFNAVASVAILAGGGK